MKKMEFVLSLMKKNPALKAKEASAAWTENGGEGNLSETAFYTAKRTFLKSHKPPTQKNKSVKTATKKAKKISSLTMNSSAELNPTLSEGLADELEATIDGMLAKLYAVDDTENIQGCLRSVRRMIIRNS